MHTRLRPLARAALVAALAALAARAAVPAAAPGAVHAQNPGRCANPNAVVEGVVRLAGGAPAPGAEVSALAALTGGGLLMATATTDAHGHYRLEHFCPGVHLITARLATSAGVLSGAYDADGDGTADTITLTADAPTATGIDIALGHHPVPPAATAAPHPTAASPQCVMTDGEIRGTVFDGHAQPVAGATIFFRGRTVAGTLNPAVLSAADGSYAVPRLCEGSYHVGASKTLADGTVLSGAHPDAVVLGPDRRLASGIDIVLVPSAQQPPTVPPHPTAHPPIAPSPGTTCRVVGSLSGTVALPDGAGVGGVSVQIVPQQSSAIGSPPALTVISHADGRWVATGVCHGGYVLLATKVTVHQALAGTLDADADGQPDLVTVDTNTPDHVGLAITLRDLLAPAPNPFWRAGRVRPIGSDPR